MTIFLYKVIIILKILNSMKIIMDHHKDSQSKLNGNNDQLHSQHLSGFQELHKYIQKLSQYFSKEVQKLETMKLQQYREDLSKTKQQFNELNKTRSQNAIKKTVYAHKKLLQKECSMFLEKSIEINKIYEDLKSKLGLLNSNQEQLEHQILYLEKQIRVVGYKNQFMKTHLTKTQQFYNKFKQNKSQSNGKSTIQYYRVLENIQNYQKAKQFNEFQVNKGNSLKQIFNKTKELRENSIKRLQEKVQNTKQYLNSIVFEQTTIENLFSLYDPKCYKQEKKKIALMESLLNQDHVKKLLYSLLFRLETE